VVVDEVAVADVVALALVVVDEMLDCASATGAGRAYSLDPQPESVKAETRTTSGASTRTDNSWGTAGTAAGKIASVSVVVTSTRSAGRPANSSPNPTTDR
jgi:hypothetical protein